MRIFKSTMPAVCAILSLSILAGNEFVTAQVVESSTSASPSATPAAMRAPASAFAQPQRIHRKPIPVWVKLAVLVSLFLSGAIFLVLAMRAWRKWNLFDRQYRFPPNPKPALRFGGTKSGGCMATIAFGAHSTSKDA